MSPKDRERYDPLESLIATYLEAEKSGQKLDRDELIEKHPDLADSLREFFANHDQMKAAANLDEPTLPPPGSAFGSPSHAGSRPTPLPTGEDPTLPPAAGASKSSQVSVGDRVRYFGDYELLEEIARGGMGVVFKARQIDLNRVVALKMILAGGLAGDEEVKRFKSEAESAAQLDHPGIVPIFEIGEHQGQHYFSMGYIEGESLAHKVADGPLPPREAAELVKRICDAMSYAHERGVIHRDLKPANVLIDANGQPKVTDFGLAKRTEADSGLTGTGQILGTPSYMPPEQASGETSKVGPAADVYALGAILYTILTGRPPFQSANPMETLLQVLEKEPIPPRQLDSSVPADLETICLKCLRKERAKRYPSAKTLGEELQRFLRGEPILARPVGRIERARRWCERNPAVASLSGLVALSLLIGSAVSTFYAFEARKQESIANSNAAEAIAKGRLAEQKAGEALVEAARATRNAAEADEQRQQAERERTEALRQQEIAERNLYAFQITAAQTAIQVDRTSVARELLRETRWDLRGWEHRFLLGQLNDSGSSLRMLKGHRRSPSSVRLSRKGNLAVSGDWDGIINVWDINTESLLGSWKGHDDAVLCVAFSSEGKWIASGGIDGTVRLWDTKTEDLVHSLDGHGDRVSGLSFSPNGQSLATCSSDKSVRVWDCSSGREKLCITTRAANVVVAFSPDGRKLVTGGAEPALHVWDSASGRPLTSLRGHSKAIRAVGFLHDGSRLVSGGSDRTVKVWNLEDSQLQLTLQGHAANVTAVGFNPDGSRIFSGSSDGTVRLWDATTGQQLLTLSEAQTSNLASGCDFSSDGSRIAACDRTGAVAIWTAEPIRQPLEIRTELPVYGAAFSKDGSLLATSSMNFSGLERVPALKVWDLRKGREKLTFEGHLSSIAISSDNQRVAGGGVDGSLTVWDLMTGTEICSVNAHRVRVLCLAFSPDGKTVVSGGDDLSLKSWDLPTGTLQRVIQPGGDRVACVAFNPDGSYLVSASSSLKIWNTANFGTPRTLERLESGAKFRSAIFSRDGSRVIAGDDNGSIGVWDVTTGNLLHKLEGLNSPVTSLGHSLDDNRVYGYTEDGCVRIWTTTDEENVQVLQSDDAKTTFGTLSGDGTRLATGSVNQVKVWNVSDLSERKSTQSFAEIELLSPEDNAVLPQPREGAWRFDWDDQENVATYQITVIGASAKAPLVHATTNESQFTVPTRDSLIMDRHQKGWTWRVRARSATGDWGPWSDARVFNVAPP